MAAVKDQDDIVPIAKIGEGNPLSIHVLQSEIGRPVADLHSFEIHRF